MHACREHHEAIRILLELFPTKAPIDCTATSKLLERLKNVLLAHLKLEDTRLYPALESSGDCDVRQTAARYRLEMGGLRASFVSLLGTWPSETEIAADPALFMSEFTEFRKALEVRMAKEDHGLYAIAEDYLSRDDIA